MSTVVMQVRGVRRNVHLEQPLNNSGKTRARVNSNGVTVSGFVTVNSLGQKRFTPIGKYSDVL